jgi:hypothetical protein
LNYLLAPPSDLVIAASVIPGNHHHKEAAMSRVTRLALPLLLLALVAGPVAPVSAGDTEKVAHGIVTAVRGDSVMISLASDTDVIFRVDQATRVVARGGGTKMRQAKAEGAPGVKLSDALAIGAAVRVSYEDIDGQTRHAKTIRLISRAPSSTR